MIWLKLFQRGHCFQRNDPERNTLVKKGIHLYIIWRCLIESEAGHKWPSCHMEHWSNAYGGIFVQRAATHTDVNTSSCNGESAFEKSNLLKWALIMSETSPLKDNVHNFQKGHNGKHMIWWSLWNFITSIMASPFHSDLSGLNEKLQNPSSGWHLGKFTQKPNKTPYAHWFRVRK